ncbi:SusC/RagA family TonB-linked outer membrane protein [Flavitalea flava]
MKGKDHLFYRTIRVSHLFICLSFCGISLLGYTQNTERFYSFTWKGSQLSRIFEDIESSGKVHFSYNPRDVDVSRKFSLKINHLRLNEMIAVLAKQIKAQYKIVGETIMIQALKEGVSSVRSEGTFLFRGRVMDGENEPLQGVVITNNTRQKNALSGKDGTFSIPAGADDIVYFQMVGYEFFSLIAAESKSDQVITLKQRITELNKVVVTALGIKREERALGYAYSEVDGKELKKARETNVINSLAGKVPGLVITSTAGGPAGSSRVIIRGNTTITGNNQPLYVVDGVPIDNSNYGQVGSDKYSGGVDFGDAISGINPDDIDKISVLKGPSASALYGSRAANGVILIITKKGSTKKDLGIEFNSTVSIEKQLTHFNGYQYLYGQGNNEKLVNDPAQAKATLFSNFGPRLDPKLMVMSFDGVQRPFALVKNNIENFFRTGSTATNTLAFTNSGERSSFRFSVSDMRNNDIVPKSNMHRTSFTLNGNSKFGNKITLEARAFYLNEQVNNRPALADDPANIGNNFIGLANNVDQALFKTGYKDVRGSYVDWGGGQYRLDPYWVINEMNNTTKKDRFIGGLQANYAVRNWLGIQGRASTDFTYLNYKKFAPRTTPGTLSGRLDEIDQKFSTTEADLIVSLQKQVSPAFYLSARMGGSLSRVNNFGNTMGFTNMVVTDVVSPNSFSDKTLVENNVRKSTNSLYGLFSMAYKSYFYLDATIRNDVSSTLPVNNNSYTYTSLSGSFIFSDALKLSHKILTYGKLRASVAEVGNDTDPYQLELYYNLNPLPVNGHAVGGVSTTVVPNKNLKPTRTRSFEVGTDLKFLDNRVGLQATYYSQDSRDQINKVPAPLSSGFPYQIINAGVISNKGVELLVTAKPVVTKNFTWDISVNFAKNVSKVKSLAAGVPFLALSDARWLGVSVVAMPGAPYGAILGYDYQKDAKGEIILDPVTLAPQPGSSRQVIGKGVFDWTGGLVSTFSYKDFSLGTVLDIKTGAQLFSMTNLFATIRGNSTSTLAGRAEWIQSEENRQSAGKTFDEWKAMGNVKGYVPKGVVQTGTDAGGHPVYAANTQALDPAVYWGNFYSDGNGIAVPFIYNASYIKVREITVSYRVPLNTAGKHSFKELSISVVSRNPFIIHKDVPNVDPDSNYNNGNGQGFEYGSLPSRRSWGFNLNFRF